MEAIHYKTAQCTKSLFCRYFKTRKTLSAQAHAYRQLGLPEGATKEEIKIAFRELAKIYHPDVNAASGALEKFQLFVEAYETLMLTHSDKTARIDANKYRAGTQANDFFYKPPSTHSHHPSWYPKNSFKGNENDHLRQMWEVNYRRSQAFWDNYQKQDEAVKGESASNVTFQHAQQKQRSKTKDSCSFSPYTEEEIHRMEQLWKQRLSRWQYDIHQQRKPGVSQSIMRKLPYASPKHWKLNTKHLGHVDGLDKHISDSEQPINFRAAQENWKQLERKRLWQQLTLLFLLLIGPFCIYKFWLL